ncbi:MAG TPA: restriction endonuclease subunit S [Chlorobaculum parvum]|uniref:Restriction endonuclease subunit S n=1 Tax=Chlorobaculum parvum TaxID=274539 RepID=A0A7C5DDR5_9CHLB|nr:restriction endonuclease subunit S [Chlorobaculum parvum]
MRHPAYPEYKESGVQWLGNVPEHWEVRRLKMAAYLNDRKVEADEENPVPYIGLENIESWTGKLLQIDPNIVPSGVANRFTKKNILFGKLRPYLAKACNPGFDGLCSTELLVIESEDFDRRTLLYLLLADGFIKFVDSSTYGSKMPRANWDFIGNCLLPIPPLSEQTAIADFLDRETGRIDGLLARKRWLIELLREKRTALISRTVTRGLPADAAREFGLEPHTRFRDSGIDWLGEVPEGWEVKRLGYITKKIGSGKTPSGGAETYVDEGVMFLRSQNVYDEGLRLADIVCIDEDVDLEMSSSRVKPLDVLLNITGASLGRTCIVPGDFQAANVNQHVCIIRMQNVEQSHFIAWVMKSAGIKAQIQNAQTGAAREGLNFEQISKLVFVLPPLPEQIAIATYLDRETSKIDRLVEKVEAAVGRLQEYRTALITAAVTGKIDVRERETTKGVCHAPVALP